MDGMCFLKEYQSNQGQYLPMVDHATQFFPSRSKHGDVNIGWNCGVLGGNRPWFIECWAIDGITLVTFFLSVVGVEGCSREQLNALLEGAGLYRCKPGSRLPATALFTDEAGNLFHSVNLIVGDEDQTYVEQSVLVYPFNLLNEHNHFTPA